MFKAIKNAFKLNSKSNEQIRAYFCNCMDTINISNLYMLRKVCMYISIVYIAMLGLAVLFVPNFRVTFAYVMIVPLIAIFFFINLYTKRHEGEISTNLTGLICGVFYYWMAFIFIMMDVVSFPTTQALWTPMVVVVFPMIYIDRMYKYGLEELSVIIVFCLFGYVYKPQEVFAVDMYSITAAYVLSMLSAHIILEMRSREGLAMIELREISSQDKLTHVLNKGALIEKIDQYYALKPQEAPCAMCVVDLDDFKHVNDNLGHTAGDLLLERVGQLLKESFRSYDIIGRYGGDEFVVMMPDMADIGILEMRCRTLQMLLTDFCVGNGQPFSVSIGAIIDQGNHSMADVFSMADDALYKSKLLGKNRCTTWIVDKEPPFSKPFVLVCTNEEHSGIDRLKDGESPRFEILIAHSDDEALCYISQYHDEIRLIIAEMDAKLEACSIILKYVKTREGFSGIPILAVAQTDADIDQAKALGADDTILKSSSKEAFEQAVGKLVRM